MSNEKRFVLFFILSITLMLGTQALLRSFGLLAEPPKPAPAVAAPEPAKAATDQKATEAAPGAEPEKVDKAREPAIAQAPETPPAAAPQAKEVPLVEPAELLLGSASDKTPGGYHLAVQLEQKGAGVAWIASSRFEAERVEGRPKHRPLQLIEDDPFAPPSFGLMLVETRPATVGETLPTETEIPLDALIWEVVRDDHNRAVRPVVQGNQEGQEVVFRATLDHPPLEITKRFRLWKGEDGLDLELRFASRDGDQKVVYRLMGPHKVPIEGEWYTSTFRDVFFDQVGAKFITHSAYDVAKGKTERLVTSPLKYAGVENRYFAVFVEPVPRATTKDDSPIAETDAVVIHETADPSKADVTVRLTSKPIAVGPDRPVTQTFRIFAGPKTIEALAAYGAEELASYRKGSIPLLGDVAGVVSKYVITPLLDRIYAFTAAVARIFGGTRGSYGIAIILLTMTVRLVMFPLSRKQAASAKKMQDIQPLMMELKEKYKDDKERLNKEMMALYSRYGVNPFGGCLTALIQLPIFIGLWQSLDNSVALRHAPFLWIENLAAPDMLFKFPVTVPFLGDYFNALPFLVVALMLFQTKLFTPPATTPEAEMQQKMMKFMMIIMAFMFYKVPSGLGFYIITSSLWSIGERLLLPQPASATAPAPDQGERGKDDAGPGPGGGKGPGPGGGNGAPKSWLGQRIEALLEEAAHTRTIRNAQRERNKDKERDKPRARPGKRR
jgi:YidC/Oxa1 family membrane protein insertase